MQVLRQVAERRAQRESDWHWVWLLLGNKIIYPVQSSRRDIQRSRVQAWKTRTVHKCSQRRTSVDLNQQVKMHWNNLGGFFLKEGRNVAKNSIYSSPNPNSHFLSTLFQRKEWITHVPVKWSLCNNSCQLVVAPPFRKQNEHTTTEFVVPTHAELFKQ